jgi:hypothetical protein
MREYISKGPLYQNNTFRNFYFFVKISIHTQAPDQSFACPSKGPFSLTLDREPGHIKVPNSIGKKALTFCPSAYQLFQTPLPMVFDIKDSYIYFLLCSARPLNIVYNLEVISPTHDRALHPINSPVWISQHKLLSAIVCISGTCGHFHSINS